MKKLKYILAVSAIALMAVVFMPMLQGSDGQASAVTGAWNAIGTCEWQLTGEENGKTLTIRPENGGESGTLPDDYGISDAEGKVANPWPWCDASIVGTITKVVINEGVKPGNSTARMFYQMDKCAKIEGLTEGTFNTSAVTNMQSMFAKCPSLKSLDLSGFDTSNVTDMSYMFNNATGIETITFGEKFKTGEVTTMLAMFQLCEELTSLDLSGFDTSKVTNMSSMFKSCGELDSLDLLNFNTAKVTNMRSMFEGCVNLKSIDLSSFDTSNVTYTYNMFAGSEEKGAMKVEKITFGENFKTGEVTNMSAMFQCCEELTSLDLSGFDTSKVTKMSYMFKGCNNIESLDLSSFNTGKVEDMTEMFKGCKVSSGGTLEDAYSSLETIIVDPNKWSTAPVVDAGKDKDMFKDMFKNCANLVGGEGTTYSESNVGKEYARVDDTGSGKPGYLTSPKQYLADKSIVLKGGKAYDYVSTTGATGMNITAAAASMGLKYMAADGETPASWNMSNFEFATKAARAVVVFEDGGTAEKPADVNINVAGTNSIKSGDLNVKDDSSVGIDFTSSTGSNVNVVISGGTGTQNTLNVEAGNVTGNNSASKGCSIISKWSLTLKNVVANFTAGEATGNFGNSFGVSTSGVFTAGNGASVQCTATKNCTQFNRGIFAAPDNGSIKVEGTGAIHAQNAKSESKNGAVYSKLDEPDARAVDFGTSTKLTWDTEDMTYKNGDNIAKDVIMTAKQYEVDLRDGKGSVTKETTDAVTEAVNAAKTGASYSKEFAGWSESIDNKGGGDLIQTGNLVKGKQYYAVWKNNDTNKTVVTKQLNFDYGSDATDFASGTDLASATGISWSGTTLTLSNATVDAYGKTGAGIRLSNDNAKVVVTEGTVNSISFNNNAASLAENEKTVAAFFTPGTLDVSGKGTMKVNTKATDGNAVTVGILAYGNAAFDEATVTVNADSNPIYVADLGSSEEQSRTLTINGGNLTAKAKTVTTDTSDYAIHVHKGDIIINGGTVTTTGGSHGIIAGTNDDSNTGKIKITNGTVNATSANTGIWAHDNVEITGGTVTAIGAEYGIRSKKENIEISGGDTVVTAKGTTAAFNLELGKTVTANNAVIMAGENEESASVKTGDVTAAVTGNKYVKIRFEPVFDDCFGGTVTKDNYKNWTHGDYTLEGWYYNKSGTSTKLEDSEEPQKGVTYTAKWTKGGKVVITEPLDFTSMETTDKSEQGWSWDKTSNTLTLKGAIIDVYGSEKAESSADTQAVILLPDGAKLIVDDNTENTINLNSTMTDKYAFAIEGKGTLEIGGKGTLNVNAKKESDESEAKVYGISTSGKLSINDLTLNVFGQDKAIYKGDSNTDNIEISGGTINAKCNTADGDVIVEDNGKYAIHAENGDIVISDGTVNVNGGAIGIISSKGKVDISGGTVTVDSGTQGLYAKTSVDITGGTVNATAHGYVEGQTGKSAKAIYSQGTIGISGTANVSANCINDKDVTAEGANFYGIRAKDNITITGNKAVVTAKGTTAAFNLDSGKTVTANNAVIRAGEDETSASVKTGDVTAAVTGNKYAKINFEPLFDDRFGGTELTKDSYTKNEVPSQDCHAKTQGYIFAGWSTAIDDAGKIIEGDFEDGTTYYAVWKNAKTGKIVVTEPMDLNRALSETDKLETYGYKYEAGSESGSTLELTLDDFTMDVCDVSGNNNAALQINRNTEIDLSGDSSIYVDAIGNGATGIYSYGTEASDDTVTIEKSKSAKSGKLSVIAKASGEEMTGLAGIHIDGSALKIKSVTVKAKTGELKAASDSVNCYGILVDSGSSDALDVRGGKVIAESGDSTGSSYGILAQGSDRNISISNRAEVIATSGDVSDSGAAIMANGKIDVDGSFVKAVALHDQGIVSSGGNIEIDNSSVHAAYEKNEKFTADNGKGYCIYAQKGDVDITGSRADVDVRGALIGIIARTSDENGNGGSLYIEDGDITVDAAKEGLWAGKKIDIEGGKVSATAHGATDSSAKAIYSQGTIKLGKADVTAKCIDTSLETEYERYGIRAKADITLTDPEKLLVKGVTAAFNINDGTSDKTLFSNTSLVGFTNVDGTEGKTVLNPAKDTGAIALNCDTYKCVCKKEADPPGPTPATKYTVTFDNQGHGAVPQSQSVEKGGKVSDPGSLTEEGYVFGGWFTDKECTAAWDFDKDTVTKDITLYAKWTEKKKELIDIEDCDIELSKYEFVFNNKVQTPEVTVRYGESILTEGQDYAVNVDEYTEVGKYDVEISGIGEYTGVTVDHYTINPAPKAVKAVKAGKKKLAVYWKKSTKAYREQTTKFQIRYSTSKKFTAAKNVYAEPAASGKVIKKLKAHKTYYVKMRVIKDVNGEKFYSSWSKVKAEKTK